MGTWATSGAQQGLAGSVVIAEVELALALHVEHQREVLFGSLEDLLLGERAHCTEVPAEVCPHRDRRLRHRAAGQQRGERDPREPSHVASG